MAAQLNAKFLGSTAGNFKFQDDSFRTVVFSKCSKDLINQFELLSNKNINQYFNIGYIHFNDQDVKIINHLSLI